MSANNHSDVLELFTRRPACHTPKGQTPTKPEHNIHNMTSDPPPRIPRRRGPPGALVLWILIVLPCCAELVLQAADAGFLGGIGWRMRAYQNGAFWIGLLGNWQPNYAAQPALMFLTYAVLHASAGHLIGNMLALGILGYRLMPRIGSALFLLIYITSVAGGGAGFALLSSTAQPMVGASGALFGLAGALLYDETRGRRHPGPAYGVMLALIAGLAVLNLVFWILEDGLLAWQAHLGGFVTGWVIMVLIRCCRKTDTPLTPDSSG